MHRPRTLHERYVGSVQRARFLRAGTELSFAGPGPFQLSGTFIYCFDALSLHMGQYVPLRYARRRSTQTPEDEDEAPAPVRARSHAAIIPALVLMGVGLWLGTLTVFAPVVIGFFMLSAGFSFLGARLNPLSVGFYLNTKPSWSAIGAIFLSAIVLLYSAYTYYIHHWGPLIPTGHFGIP